MTLPMWPFKRVEKRTLDTVPWDVGGPVTVTVNETTALGLSAVFASCRHLGDLISTLPLHAYRQDGTTRKQMDNLPQLLRLLEDSGRLPAWLFEASTSLALHGNAVGAITRFDGMGFPADVTWLPMPEIVVDDSNLLRPQWYWKGRRVSRDEIVHIPWFKMPGRTLGLSPIEAYALTIANGVQAQQYGNDWFSAGGFPPGTFKNANKTVSQEEADAVKARLVSAIRTRKPLVYGADWDYNPLTVPPEQAQFIETMKLTANQVAAIYGIAPDEVGGEAANSLTYTTEELRQIRRLSDARPWMVRLETGISALLPDRQYVKFAADAVVRADVKTRFEVYQIGLAIGAFNQNEVRALEERGPIPGGELFATPSAPPTAPPPPGSGGHSLTP